jgi:hypothetical protein
MCSICHGAHDDYRSAIACEANGVPSKEEYSYTLGTRLTIRQNCSLITVTIDRLTVMHYTHEAGYIVHDLMGTRHTLADDYLRHNHVTSRVKVRAVALE